MRPKQKSKTICLLPWIHSATDALGFIRVCCVIYHPYGYLGGMSAKTTSPTATRNHPVLKNIRATMLRGEEPKECKRCFDRERSGLRSKRITLFTLLNNVKSLKNLIFNNTKEDGEIDPAIFPIRYYDLRVSNQCNSRCIMCSASNSSMWGDL